MIELTNVPEVIYTAVQDDVFLVNGEEFKFEELGHECFLTRMPDNSPWVHIRDITSIALFSRQELVMLLTSGDFIAY